MTVRAEGRSGSTRPVLIVARPRVSHVHLPDEAASELRAGRFSEAVCQAFVHSFSFRISHVVNTFPLLYTSM